MPDRPSLAGLRSPLQRVADILNPSGTASAAPAPPPGAPVPGQVRVPLGGTLTDADLAAQLAHNAQTRDIDLPPDDPAMRQQILENQRNRGMMARPSLAALQAVR
jgi:hypothetical protein